MNHQIPDFHLLDIVGIVSVPVALFKVPLLKIICRASHHE
jgi:hypothetical protein